MSRQVCEYVCEGDLKVLITEPLVSVMFYIREERTSRLIESHVLNMGKTQSPLSNVW